MGWPGFSSQYGVGRGRAGVTAHAPVVVVRDAGDIHERAGQVRAVDGGTATIMLHLEANIIGTRQCSIALFAADCGAAAGNPCVVQVNPANDYAIVSVRSAPPADGAMELRYQRDGQTFSPGRIEKG